MDDEARQLAAATRAFEAARDLHELHVRVWEQSAELTAAIREAAEAGVPRNSPARITGLSRTRVSEHRHGRAILVEPGSFSGEPIAPPYPGRTPPGIPAEPEKRLPGEPSKLRDVPVATLERERELLRRLRDCLDLGITIRQAAETVGVSKSLVGRYYRLLRSDRLR